MANDPSLAGKVYMDALAYLRIAPNFFVGASFWGFSGWTPRFIIVNDVQGVEIIDEDGTRMLPPIFVKPRGFAMSYDHRDWPYWAGFSQHTFDFQADMRLDDEFIYNPAAFKDLSGRKWKLVRKNLHACEDDCGERLCIVQTVPDPLVDTFMNTFVETMAGEVYYDPEAILATAMTSPDRMFVVGVTSGKLYAILAFDGNWLYVNFRLCLVAAGIRGLSDYCRVLFYCLLADASPGRLVNDGGSLDSPGLREYKLRLHPLAVNTIYSNLGVQI